LFSYYYFFHTKPFFHVTVLDLYNIFHSDYWILLETLIIHYSSHIVHTLCARVQHYQNIEIIPLHIYCQRFVNTSFDIRTNYTNYKIKDNLLWQ
jgi:hypothetical protein